MQLIKKMQMNTSEIECFLHKMETGRLATLNEEGYPVMIPLNFVYLHGCIYFHSAPVGEKLANIRQNAKVGFEVDQHIATIPSYYFYDSQDPSETDTLYKSVVIVGQARIVDTQAEKVLPLQKLMEKYQPEGGYEPLTAANKGLQHATVVEISIEKITGKKKIGQHWPEEKRLYIAERIYRGHPNYQDIFAEIDITLEQHETGIKLSVKHVG